MAIWNGLTDTGAVVPIQVDDQGRVVVSGGGGLPSQVYGTAKALGQVASDGSVLGGLNMTATLLGTGNWQITFINPLSTDSYAVVANIGADVPGFISAYDFTQSGFKVRSYDYQGNFKTETFTCAVFDNQPSDVTPLILPVSALNDIERLKAAAGLDDDSPIS